MNKIKQKRLRASIACSTFWYRPRHTVRDASFEETGGMCGTAKRVASG
jgi:hypothetical protein